MQCNLIGDLVTRKVFIVSVPGARGMSIKLCFVKIIVMLNYAKFDYSVDCEDLYNFPLVFINTAHIYSPKNIHHILQKN